MSETYALRQAVWKYEDAVQMHHAGDKPYEHVQAWRDAIVSAAMDMRDAAVAAAVAAEAGRVGALEDALRNVLAYTARAHGYSHDVALTNGLLDSIARIASDVLPVLEQTTDNAEAPTDG